MSRLRSGTDPENTAQNLVVDYGQARVSVSTGDGACYARRTASRFWFGQPFSDRLGTRFARCGCGRATAGGGRPCEPDEIDQLGRGAAPVQDLDSVPAGKRISRGRR